VGCIEKPVRSNSLRYLQVDHAGLHDYPSIDQVHFKDTVHASQANHHPVFDRQCAPAQSRTRTARYKRNAFAMAHSDDPLDLFSGAGKQDRLGNNAEIRKPVTFVGRQFFLRRDQTAISSDGAELLKDAGVHEYLVWAADWRTSLTGSRVVA